MRRASHVIITSLKELRHSLTRSAVINTHIDPCTAFYTPICRPKFSSIPDKGGFSGAPPASAASTDDKDNSPSTSSSPSIDTLHMSATELVWPMSRQQEKFAGRVYRALSAVFSNDSTLQDVLIRELGFVIKEVRVSPDHAKVFILWDSYNGQAKEAARALKMATPRIRAGVAKALAARNVPRLDFRLDKVSEDDAEIERLFLQIEQERDIEKEGQK